MANHDSLIDALSASALPVRRPLPPTWRTAVWTCAALPMGAAVGLLLHRAPADWSRPGAGLAAVALALSFAAGVLSIWTALTLSIPGREAPSRRVWAAILLGWIAAAATALATAQSPVGRVGDGAGCYEFMLLVSAPMMALVVLTLRRTRPLRPTRCLALAGLGVAFLSLSLLTLCHPLEARLIDLAMHLGAGATIVAATVLLGRRWVSVD